MKKTEQIIEEHITKQELFNLICRPNEMSINKEDIVHFCNQHHHTTHIDATNALLLMRNINKY